MSIGPAYERTADRETQGLVAAEISEAWDCEVIPTQEYAAVDFFFVSNKTYRLAMGELKHRKNHREHYPTLILSVSKLDAITTAAEVLKVPFFLFVQWADGLYWRRIASADLPNLPKITGGRNDRNDPRDTETVYELPISGFRPLRKAFWQMEEPMETSLQ